MPAVGHYSDPGVSTYLYRDTRIRRFPSEYADWLGRRHKKIIEICSKREEIGKKLEQKSVCHRKERRIGLSLFTVARSPLSVFGRQATSFTYDQAAKRVYNGPLQKGQTDFLRFPKKGGDAHVKCSGEVATQFKRMHFSPCVVHLYSTCRPHHEDLCYTN